MASLSVVIVTYCNRDVIGRTLAALRAQLRAGDEIVVVDNASRDGTADEVDRQAHGVVLRRNESNEGFAAAANSGAALSGGELLVFLNPDAVPEPGFADAIRAPLEDGRGWAAWMGLVLADRGASVNTSGGVVHFTGIAWAGQAGQPVAHADGEPREVAFASGACLALPASTWHEAGGFAPEFFMYCEDVDLSLRLRLAGGRLGLEPRARVDHDYAFHKGALKWRLLERNRWATIIRTYPAPLLGVLAPALVATEVALVAVAVDGGWGRSKALAACDTLLALPRLLRERRAIQATRRVSSAHFAAFLVPELSSPYLGAAARSRALRGALLVYWRLVITLLRAGRE